MANEGDLFRDDSTTEEEDGDDEEWRQASAADDTAAPSPPGGEDEVASDEPLAAAAAAAGGCGLQGDINDSRSRSSSSSSSSTTATTTTAAVSPRKSAPAGLTVGSHCDARDSVGTWYESVIVGGPKRERRWLVHFKGWNQKFDEWIPADSGRIKPQWSEVRDWRSQLKQGKEVDIKVRRYRGSGICSAQWMKGRVVCVTGYRTKQIPGRGEVMVCSSPAASSSRKRVAIVEYLLKKDYDGIAIHDTTHVDLDSEDICPRYTHVKVGEPGCWLLR